MLGTNQKISKRLRRTRKIVVRTKKETERRKRTAKELENPTNAVTEPRSQGLCFCYDAFHPLLGCTAQLRTVVGFSVLFFIVVALVSQ